MMTIKYNIYDDSDLFENAKCCVCGNPAEWFARARQPEVSLSVVMPLCGEHKTPEAVKRDQKA